MTFSTETKNELSRIEEESQSCRLAEFDDFVELVKTDDGVVFGGVECRTVEMLGSGGVERIVDQCRLAGAGNAGDAGE